MKIRNEKPLEEKSVFFNRNVCSHVRKSDGPFVLVDCFQEQCFLYGYLDISTFVGLSSANQLGFSSA